MPLDDGTRAFLAAMAAAAGPPLYERPVEEVRMLIRTMQQQVGGPAPDVKAVRAERVSVEGGDIEVRIYWPHAESVRDRLPMLLYFHGGGWAAGDLDSHDGLARAFCAQAGLIVANVGYRLAPEQKFPVQVEDSYRALCWAADQAARLGADAARIAVGGDSAGGNLAAAITLLARDRGGPRPAFQLLLYPAVDLDLTADYPSRREFGGGEYFLSAADMRWFTSLYLRSAADAHDPLASPLRAADLSRLPPALVVTAGHDMLRDEAKAYADRLRAAGVAVEYRCFESTIHAFLSFGGVIPLAGEGLQFAASRLRQALAPAGV